MKDKAIFRRSQGRGRRLDAEVSMNEDKTGVELRARSQG